MSKQFLAAGIMLLAQDGRLAVDDKVADTSKEMTDTRVTTLADLVPNRARGYAWSGGRLRTEDDWPAWQQTWRSGTCRRSEALHLERGLPRGE